MDRTEARGKEEGGKGGEDDLYTMRQPLQATYCNRKKMLNNEGMLITVAVCKPMLNTCSPFQTPTLGRKRRRRVSRSYAPALPWEGEVQKINSWPVAHSPLQLGRAVGKLLDTGQQDIPNRI